MSTAIDTGRPLVARARSDDLDPFGLKDSDFVTTSLDGRNKSFDADSFQGGGGQSYRYMMRLAGDSQMSKPFLQNPWIYACVSKRANARASMPLRFRDGKGVKVSGTRLDRLMDKPNPLMSRMEFVVAHSLNMDLFGECFWVLMKRGTSERTGVAMVPISRGDFPDEIWPVRGDAVSPVMDDVTKLPRAWRIGDIEYPAHAVAQFAFTDPYNPLRGVGPVQAAMRTAYKDFQIDRFDEALLRNGGSPCGVLTLQGTLNSDQRRALRNAWHESVETPERHRQTAVLELGTTYQQYGFNPQEMEFKDFRGWNRDTYMAIFGVTRALLALTEGLNYASATEAKKIFWHDTIKPLSDADADKVTAKFLRQIRGPESDWTSYYDMSEVNELQETLSAKIDRFMKLLQQCGLSKNEAARIAELDIGEVQDGDRLFVPASMQPLPEEAAKYRTPAAEPVSKALSDGDTQELYMRRMEELLLPLDRKLASKVERVQRDFVLSTRAKLRDLSAKVAVSTHEKLILTEQEVEDLVQLNTQKWISELEGRIDAEVAATWDAGAWSIAAELQIAAMRSTDPLVVQFLSGKRLQLAEGSMTTLAEQVRLTIMRSLATASSDLSIAEAIADKLRELEAEMKSILETIEARAMRIARTENTSIYNGSRTENMLHAGVSRHKWLTAGDEHVRSSHKSLNGTVAIVGQVFDFNLRYPGDPQASAAQVVGCRCTTVPVQDEPQ